MPANRDPALGLIESASIARGLKLADAMVKKSPIRLLRCYTVSPGKHLTLVSGDVDEVLEAMREGQELAGDYLLDKLFLPQIHPAVLAALEEEPAAAKLRSVGVIECLSVASTLLAADAAVKTAEVEFVEMKLGAGLGGKGYFVLSGELDMIEAAVEAGINIISPKLFYASEIIPAPHEELSGALSAPRPHALKTKR